jgi:hypothetical protein
MFVWLNILLFSKISRGEVKFYYSAITYLLDLGVWYLYFGSKGSVTKFLPELFDW